MTRGRTSFLAIAIAATAAAAVAAAPTAAGTVRGQVELSAAPVAAGPRSNPYPGRANSLPGARPANTGNPGETVILLKTLPAGLAVPPAPASVKPELEQKQQAFAPRVLAIQVGTTVEFPNRDPVYHNVFSVSPAKRFDLGKYAQGHSRRVRFDKPGLVNVYCDIHSDMAAWVYVVPHHVFAQANASGRFALPEVPAGHYTLVAWHPDRGEITIPVDVSAHDETTVTVRL